MKTVLITGGASGLGLEISKYLKEIGYNIVLTYNSTRNIDNIKKEIGENIHAVKCDNMSDEDINKLGKYLKENDIKIDILINNSAVCFDSLYEEKNRDKFIETLNVNLVGTFLISRLIGDMMYKNKSGVILNISSTNGIDKYYPMSLDYDASKAGLNSLTHNLALEYSPFVRVNAIAPGWVKTKNEMKELDEDYIKMEEEKIFIKRMAEPIEICKIIEFLISDNASYINNQIIVADGGTYNG